jgi:hypothetical protein
MFRTPLLSSVLVLTTACATVALNPNAAHVAVLTSPPAATCETLSPVYGQGGGYWTVGEFVPNDKLIASAINDARNKAAMIGATHILPGPPQLVAENTTATVTASTYRCLATP